MKLMPPFLLAMLILNASTASPHMAAARDQLVHIVKAGTEGTSVDNHHAIPRPEYDSWSSPGNMPGSGHDIGSEEAKP
ncbi:hypothetical protein GQ55_7G038200 [Panicum hallii var. hallii]|jgi:hypothetical protein|uniref:Uncharacterized protein n=2 Tax=Panicum hallii TaxID=206008 RepID=A0A2T7CSD3_9POAL|nr:hypothetical protein GQ55_7G038200 [Panicum hallii var. hallii]PVH34826.1 hypothetical protein PAHAL_7G041500 [Panicum hallii]